MVTVQSARSSRRATGRPTRFERPITTACWPDSELSASCSSIDTPSGVHGTGKSSGAPEFDRAQPADIQRMEAVDILGRIDGQQHLRGVDVLGQRQLHQDAVHGLVGVEPGDQRQQLGFGRALGQAMIEARHAELGRELALAADIDLARRVLADQHRCQARLGPAGGDQRLDARADALAQAGRVGLAVYEFRFSHLSPQTPLPNP